ncbi:antibiotic biosynthesis monooxygenase [Streptomyces thermolineatus]|uniref:Antibiotic biosynthesis monooxygenase n=1 Tax=Streptomyces thermolineatus TaxID=44033 RepID=A0ABN3M097_9ACTN
MIIVSGYLHVAPEKRDAYVAGCRGIVERARASDGCLDFALSADQVDPGRVNVYERWESDEQLVGFRGSAPDSAPASEIIQARLCKYRISAEEAP